MDALSKIIMQFLTRKFCMNASEKSFRVKMFLPSSLQAEKVDLHHIIFLKFDALQSQNVAVKSIKLGNAKRTNQDLFLLH